MKKICFTAALILMLAGCSNTEEPAENINTVEDGNASAENNAIDHGIKDGQVGFTLDDEGNAQEAEVPETEKEALLAAYQEYIQAFNAEDMDRYQAVIADDPTGFDREEDQKALAEAFSSYDSTYETSNETVVKYEEERAEVYAQINVTMKDPNSTKSTAQEGRQVVVFVKEQGEWRVSALHFIGN